MSDILAPDARSRIDAFYDNALRQKIDALDNPRRQVRWMITKALIIVLPPIVHLVGNDLFDTVLPFQASTGTMAFAWVLLIAGAIFSFVNYFLPGITAYANFRSRFKQDVVSEIFKVVCPSAVYDPLQGITQDVFDAPGLFNTRGGFRSDDRVRGRIGQTPFEASEVARTYSTGTGKNNRSYEVFRGLLFHLDFGQQLSGVTLVDPERALSHQLGVRDALSLVNFDNPAFEKEFAVHTSSESEARSLLTPAMLESLLTLRRQADKPIFLAFKGRRAYVGVDYRRTLFEPRIVQTVSKEAVREIAGHFAFVESIVRELNLNTRITAAGPDDSLLRAPDIAPNPLFKLASDKAGQMTAAEVWTMASLSIDDSAKDGDAPAPRPASTRIRVESGAGNLSITYGLRMAFWIMLAISAFGALLASSALRAGNAPAWAMPASEWVRTLPPVVPWLDRFAADAPTPWLIVGTVIAVLLALFWTGYVRRVVIDAYNIRIYRGLRPFPRVYRRPQYGRVIRINTLLYIAKSDGNHLMNPPASPVLTDAEAKWLTAEVKRVLKQR